MNPKILIGILFLITFAVSFVIYLLVVNVITPHIDLSSTTKGSIEVAPELDDNTFVNQRKESSIKAIQEKAMNDSSTYQPDIDAMMKDPNENYVPMEELGKEENSAGTLDDTAVRAPGDDYSVPSTTTDDNASDGHLTTATGSSSDVILENSEVIEDGPKLDKIEMKIPEPILNTTNAAVNEVAPTTGSPKSFSRVVVGSYGSMDEAKKEYDTMLESDLEVAPIIKEQGGKYTLQVGAFSDKQKADDLVKSLKNKNYKATIKEE